MSRAIRTVGGVVGGYATMVLLITLVQEGWFGGVGWHVSSAGVLLVAGLLTCIAAGIGGAVATAIAYPTGRLAVVIMSCLIVIETTTLVLTGKVAGPLWFDVVAALSLIAAVLLGGELLLQYRQRAKHHAPDVRMP